MAGRESPYQPLCINIHFTAIHRQEEAIKQLWGFLKCLGIFILFGATLVLEIIDVCFPTIAPDWLLTICAPIGLASFLALGVFAIIERIKKN